MSLTPVALESRPEGVPAGTAAADLVATDLSTARRLAASATPAEVERALGAPRRSLADLGALLSPAAGRRLEEMAARAHAASTRRFGRVVRMFAPLYLSNECVSTCTYCGFSAGNDIARRTLTAAEVAGEARELCGRGFRHLLLVAGEHARVVSKDHVVDCVRALSPEVPSVSIETQVWDTATYGRLVAAGCEGLVVYQETYDPRVYAAVHLKGKKRNYGWRLGAPDRGAEAGMRSITLGALLGLAPDWRSEVLSLAAHAQALSRRWWRCEVAVAAPRLRPAAGDFQPAQAVGDRDYAQVLCALRLALPEVGITLSTRESAQFRDHALRLGVTQMSAGSHTEPGGYASPDGAEPQFEVSDTRSPAEVAAAVRAAGYEPVWKDTIGARSRP